MAVLQKYRALKLWYPEDIAKAIWMAEATKYAIFKNMALSKRENIEKKLLSSGKVKSKQDLEQMDFDENFKIHFKDWWPFVWGKIFTPDRYDYYFATYPQSLRQKLEQWASNIINNTDENLLKNEQKFFNQVWKNVRDQNI